MRARMLVAVGKYAQGEVLHGGTAEYMVAQGFATDITPEPAKPAKKKKGKASPETKDAGAAPENKSE